MVYLMIWLLQQTKYEFGNLIKSVNYYYSNLEGLYNFVKILIDFYESKGTTDENIINKQFVLDKLNKLYAINVNVKLYDELINEYEKITYMIDGMSSSDLIQDKYKDKEFIKNNTNRLDKLKLFSTENYVGDTMLFIIKSFIKGFKTNKLMFINNSYVHYLNNNIVVDLKNYNVGSVVYYLQIKSNKNREIIVNGIINQI